MNSKTKALILVLGCILIGFILGVVIDRVVFLKIYHPKRFGIKEYRKEIVERLKLNETQQVKLDSILSWSQSEFKKLSSEFRPKLDSLRNATRDSIRAILNPDQLNEFEKMIKEMEKNQRR